jgi:rhodanese-related sulfurtransferase
MTGVEDVRREKEVIVVCRRSNRRQNCAQKNDDRGSDCARVRAVVVDSNARDDRQDTARRRKGT